MSSAIRGFFDRMMSWLAGLFGSRAESTDAVSTVDVVRAATPHVGPILGSVSASGARVFAQCRSASQMDKSFAVLLVKRLSTDEEAVFQVRGVNSTFADSVVFVVNLPWPGEEYAYDVWFFEAKTQEAVERHVEQHHRGSAASTLRHRFRSRPTDPAKHRIFLGSCRYMLRIAGHWLFDARSDKAFRSMHELHQADPVDNAVFVGDQIYADDLNKVKEDVTFQDFRTRYEAAFETDNFRSLTSSVSVINTLDDHEIEDNYPASMTRRDRLVKLPAALHAYDIFQMSYTPLYSTRTKHGGSLSGRPNRYWYSHLDGLVDYFAMDIRTERTKGCLVSDVQMQALKGWLMDESPAAYKVILSAVPMVPTGSNGGLSSVVEGDPDKWDYSPQQRKEVVAAIFKARDAGRRVVMLSGDIHQSVVSEVRDGRGVGFYSVVSSPLYWPWPHGDASDFNSSGRLGNVRWSNCCELLNVDSFALLEFTSAGMDVRFYPRKQRDGVLQRVFCDFGLK